MVLDRAQLSASLSFGLYPQVTRALLHCKHAVCGPSCLALLYERMRRLWVLRKEGQPHSLTHIQYFFLILNMLCVFLTDHLGKMPWLSVVFIPPPPPCEWDN